MFLSLSKTCISLLCLAALSPTWTSADSPLPYKLTPQTDLRLRPVPVEVPERFAGVSRDLELNLPPGFRFRARVFAILRIEYVGE